MNQEMSGTGYLQVRVSTAQSAVPLENALVILRRVKEDGGGLVKNVYSDQSGLTQRIALQTVSRELTEVPGNIQPFRTYDMEVSKEGYYTQFYQNVPIFDGITSVQSAEMIPLPQNGYENGLSPDDSRFFEGENPDL